MFIVGVTGGIGCGKTAVTDYLARKGIIIADADQAARVVVMPGQPALRDIARHFGEHLIQADGSLDRRALRDVIFANDSQRIWLEQLLHPLIRQQLLDELQQASSPYAVLVSPLLTETSQKEMVNRIMVVDVPEELQIARTTARDTVTADQARAIMAKQAKRMERLQQADDIVDNSGDLEHLHRQLDTFHQSYLQMAAAE